MGTEIVKIATQMPFLVGIQIFEVSVCLDTDVLSLTMGLGPDKCVIRWKHWKSKMHWKHLTFWTSSLA